MAGNDIALLAHENKHNIYTAGLHHKIKIVSSDITVICKFRKQYG